MAANDPNGCSVTSVVSPLIFLLMPHFLSCSVDAMTWVGAVTPTSFTVRTILSSEPNATLLVSTSNTLVSAISVVGDGSGKWKVENLQSARRYYFGFRDEVIGSVRTFPPEGLATDVLISMSSCQRWAEDSRVWKRIALRFERNIAEDGKEGAGEIPFLMFHMGDLHYENIDENNRRRFESAIRDVVLRPEQSRVFARIPTVYMYDDHDYGKNNADGRSKSRLAALASYKNTVPHWPLLSKNETGAVYQAFTIGRIRILITDLRSSSAREGPTAMGSEQLEWFLKELRRAKRYRVVVWVSTRPWIGQGRVGADHWGGFAGERKSISNFLVNNNITNLVIVSGDAHALAVDNGSHSDYSDKQGAGMPVFQAAPIANYGNAKGGPYSEGCKGIVLARNRQYGVLAIRDRDGERDPCVTFTGYISRKAKDEEALRFQKCGKLGGVRGWKGGGQGSRCSLPLALPWLWLVFVLALVMLVVLFTFVARRCICQRRRRAAIKGRPTAQVS